MKIFKKIVIVLIALLLFAGNAGAAVTLSKAMVDALAAGQGTAKHSVGVITTIAFADGGVGNDQITDSGNGLAGFSVGDLITVVTTSGTNDGTYEILAVAAGAVDVATGTLTGELAAAAGASALVSHRGHSIADLLKYGVMALYSGARPANPETAEAGTLLLLISESSGAFVGGTDTNGLLFDAVVDGVLSKYAGQIWSDTGIDTGTVTWGRFYANDYTTGADAGETLIRFDFDVATSGADLNMSTSVVTGAAKTIDSFTITIPVQ